MSDIFKKQEAYTGFSLPKHTEKIAFISIWILGLALRFYFYISNRDLGADEAHLALNFIHLGYRGLTLPLENFQSAPIFFLWSVETISKIFGSGEAALRVVPFVISLLSFPFFYFFVRDLTKNTLTALLAFLLFALNWHLLYFATELKPYTIDVSAYILIGFLLFSNFPFVARRRVLLLALTGSLLILYSNCSVIVLFCAGIYMLRQWISAYKTGNKLSVPAVNSRSGAIILGTWAIVFLINFFTFVYHHPYGKGMKEIWAWAFCPKNIFSSAFTDFMSARAEDTLFSNLLFFSKEYYFGYFLLAITIAALINMVVNRKSTLFLFTIAPVLIHLLLSMLQLYPFYSRFILYLVPPLIVFFSYGVVTIVMLLNKKIHWVAGLSVLLYFTYATSIKSILRYPDITKEKEIKTVLNYINRHYPNTPIMIATPYTLYYYYFETGKVNNKNFHAIEWGMTTDEYYSHSLILPLNRNYLLFYSIGDNFDGFGDILKDLKAKGLVVNQFDHSIFGLTEIKPLNDSTKGGLIRTLDYSSGEQITPSTPGSVRQIPLWNSTPFVHPITLKKGKYQIVLTARGDAAQGIFPHLIIRIGSQTIGDCNLKKELDKYTFDFEADKDTSSQIALAMDNDEIVNGEDRNAFIKGIFIIKMKD